VLASESVPLPAFRSIDLRGGGMVAVVPGPVQRVTLVEGTTQVTRFTVQPDGKLMIAMCEGRCPPGYRMRLEIQSPTVPDLGIEGGGIISVQPGFRAQRHLQAAINGGGKIDAASVEASSVAAAVNGGGDVIVRARDSLSGAVNGGGLIRYKGHPTVSSAVRGGGLVRSAD
jgi:hypothetical protein